MVWMVEREQLPQYRGGITPCNGCIFLHWNDRAGILFSVVSKKIEKRELLMKRFYRIALTVLVTCFLSFQDLCACSVCFGDPNSPIVHGAKAGVAVLLGIVGAVLCGIGAVAIYWVRRARLLEVQAALRGESIQL